jgi:hypothetical protein
MLVAKRDPFHAGAHDVPVADAPLGAPTGGAVTRFARTMSILQMVGTLLAVPLGLGSAYSMYRANFSTETTCQSLRSNIVSMLDKSVDASTRHMLVRRDVVAFEQSCGAVDPDATAAFKALLAADQKAAPPASAWVQPAESKPKEVARKAEPRAEAKAEVKTEAKSEAKIEAKSEAKPETKVASRDPAVSDAAWLAAVRGALTAHVAERVEPDYVGGPDPAPAKQALAAVPPIAQPLDRGPAVQVPVSMPPAAPPMAAALRPTLPAAAEHRSVATLTAPATIAPPASAPALPPPTSLAAAPVPQPVASAPAPDADHPVPPAFVPVIAPLPGEATAAMPRHRFGERLGALIAHVPLLGPMIEQK